MAFYIIEKEQQLEQFSPKGDCFISFIPLSDNFHPRLTDLSLIYLHPIDSKGYIFCINHNESLSLDKNNVIEFLKTKTNRLFVLDKKKAMYWFPYPEKLYDINFISQPDLTSVIRNIVAIKYFYNKFTNSPIVNRLIPISKHFEECESIFNVILPIISSFREENGIYSFNNGPLTEVFWKIENNGIKIDRTCFVDYYDEKVRYPEFNINKGKILFSL
jgi:hypothetical protein